MLCKKLFIDAWLVIETFGVSLRRESHEILVALVVLGQQYQVKVCLLTGCTRGFLFAIAACDVSLTDDNWFHTTTLHRVVERDCAVHVAVIGHGTRGHLQFFNTFRERFDLNGAVKKTVVSMKMKVYELSVLHFICVICGWLLFPLYS